MSLDIYLLEGEEAVFETNITHNLAKMAIEAGIYDALWGADGKQAGELLKELSEGLHRLNGNPEHYKLFDAENGWGTYKDFVPFVDEVLGKFLKHPFAIVSVSK
jgi:hypothetical protein